MKFDARWLVVGVLLVFAWKGSSLQMEWPSNPAVPVRPVTPSDDDQALVMPIRPVLVKMLPGDRKYLGHLYDAMAFILRHDGQRTEPIIGNTERLAAFHAGSLRLAIAQANVGKYDGLAEAIDQSFINALGADVREMTPELRGKAVALCKALSWAFQVRGDE